MLNYRMPLQKLVGCALCCVTAAAAFAGTPPGTSPGGLLGRASGILSAAPHSPASHFEFQRLDLRPPETLASRPSETLGGSHSVGAIGDSVAEPFPSAKHTQLGTATGAEDLPGNAGVGLGTLRMENRVQEFQRRVQREGLPVARLWETKTALLHVGLSPRGKPGLWLIQKVP